MSMNKSEAKAEAEEFLRQARELLAQGRVIFVSRRENLLWIEELEITIEQVYEVLGLLSVNNYCARPEEDRDRIATFLWKFGRTIEKRETYIKLKIEESAKGKVLKCLSFHLARFALEYPFASPTARTRRIMSPQPFFYCEKCDTTLDKEETFVETRVEVGRVRGEEISVEMPVRICKACGSILNDNALDNASIIATYDVYRERHNIIFPAEIIALREKYGLSQKNLALLLGLGEITVHRYEGGALAEVAPSKLLRLMNNPANMRQMLDESGDVLSARLRAKLEARLTALEAPARELQAA